MSASFAGMFGASEVRQSVSKHSFVKESTSLCSGPSALTCETGGRWMLCGIPGGLQHASSVPSASGFELSRKRRLIVVCRHGKSRPCYSVMRGKSATLPGHLSVLLPFLSGAGPLRVATLWRALSGAVITVTYGMGGRPQI